MCLECITGKLVNMWQFSADWSEQTWKTLTHTGAPTGSAGFSPPVLFPILWKVCNNRHSLLSTSSVSASELKFFYTSLNSSSQQPFGKHIVTLLYLGDGRSSEQLCNMIRVTETKCRSWYSNLSLSDAQAHRLPTSVKVSSLVSANRPFPVQICPIEVFYLAAMLFFK